MKKSMIFGALTVLLFQLSCKDNPVEPPLKDPRTYTWTIDTLAYPGSFQTSMRDIWASGPQDVYVVGHNDQNRGLMWHFDGKQWTDVRLSTTQGGNIQGPIDLSAIYGFSATNIFAVGQRIYDNPTRPPNFLDSSLIIHFDGRQWREQRVERGRLLATISGTSSSNLWTGGFTKYPYRYDGTTWNKDSLPVVIPPDGFFQINALEGTAVGEVYALGNTNFNVRGTTVYYFFQRRFGVWTIVDSALAQPGRIENKWGIGDLWVSPSGTLYSCGAGIYRWNGASWELLFDHRSFLTRVIGTSDSNMFVVGHFGAVLHFNGRDWYQYQQFANPDAVLWGVWTDGKEVMIVGHTAAFPQKTIILYGK